MKTLMRPAPSRHTFALTAAVMTMFAAMTPRAHAAAAKSLEISTTLHALPSGTSNLMIGAQYHYPVKNFLLRPRLRHSPEGFTTPALNTPRHKTSTTVSGITATLNAGASWDFGLGALVTQRKVRGTDGAPQTLPNAGQELDFHTPSKTIASTNGGIHFAIGWQRNSFRGTLEILSDAPMSKSRQSNSFLISGAYVWK